MMTKAAASSSTTHESIRAFDRAVDLRGAQSVVIVNGSPEVFSVIETAVRAGHYGVVFIESAEHAYSRIKRVQPNLVILCLRLQDMHGFQVLSMLKLDEATRSIPVVTYAVEAPEPEERDEEAPVADDPALFAYSLPDVMN